MNALVLAAIEHAKQDHAAWFAPRIPIIADQLCLIADLATVVLEYLPAGNVAHHLDTRLFLQAAENTDKIASAIAGLAKTHPMLQEFVKIASSCCGLHIVQYMRWSESCNRRSCLSTWKVALSLPMRRSINERCIE